jgi:RNA polymerase I-specific transcription initiation factor RRN3
MDPHSRLSQFNNRPPKSGPLPPRARRMDSSLPKPTLPADKTASPPPKSSTPAALIDLRPIATNSRVKQNQQLHHDLHLAYVNNALQQKALVQTSLLDRLIT